MREKIVVDISAEGEFTPQHVKDHIVQELIDKLIGKEWMTEKEKYNLEVNPQWQCEHAVSHEKKHMPQTKITKTILNQLSEQFKSGTLTADEKAKILAELYLAGILLKIGSEVALMGKGGGYDMLVLTAGNRIARLNVIADRRPDGPIVRIEIFRIADGKPVIDINRTLAEKYIIKICGEPGVRQIETNKLRKLLKANSNKIRVASDDGYSIVALIGRKILLANCESLNL